MPDEEESNNEEKNHPAGGTPPAGGGSEFKPSGFRGSSTGEQLGGESGGEPGGGGGDPPKTETEQQTEEEKKKVLGHGGREMNEEAISERVTRERKKWLRDEYGTDDPEQVKKIKEQRKAEADARAKEQKELERYRQSEERKKRAQQSELERAKSDLEKEKERSKELEEKLKQERESAVVTKQDHVIRDALSKQISDKHLKYARRDLAEHVNGLTPEEQAKFGPRQLDRWVEKYAKENPEFTREKSNGSSSNQSGGGQVNPVAPVGSEKPKPRRAPVGAKGKAPERPKPNNGGSIDHLKGKTPKPGQENSMTKSELREYLKASGRKPW